MTPDERLAAAVLRADQSLLRLDRGTAAEVTATPPLHLDAALDLHDGRWAAVVSDADGSRWVVPLVVHVDGVRRAGPGDGVAEALVAALAAGNSRVDGFHLTRWFATPVRGERGIGVDQTHDSVVVGDRAVVKWQVHQPTLGQAFEHPAVARLATLTEQGFDGTPAAWGLVTLDVEESAPLLVATVASYLPGATDGWSWAVEDLRARCRKESSEVESLEPAARLGELVARLHLAFAADGVTVATGEQAEAWAARALGDLERACLVVTGPEGVRLRQLGPQAATVLGRLADAAGTPLMPVHGDLHVGQVLRHGAPAQYSVVDFDGNPVVPPRERAAPQPGALDVAGMLASLDHVGRVVVRRTEGVDVDVVRSWIRGAREAFLGTYRDVLSEGGRSELLDEGLLRPLLVAQEVREYLYAVRHLPHWTFVPDQALPALLEED